MSDDTLISAQLCEDVVQKDFHSYCHNKAAETY